MWDLPGVIVVAFIRLPAPSDILHKGSSRHPRFRAVAGSLTHSRRLRQTQITQHPGGWTPARPSTTRASRTSDATCACTSTTKAWRPTSWWTTSTGRTPGRPNSSRRRQSLSLPHDYTHDLAGIQAPVLLIHARYDRMVPVEVRHRDPQAHRRRAPRAAQQLRPLAALREAGRVGRAGPRVPAGLLSGTASN